MRGHDRDLVVAACWLHSLLSTVTVMVPRSAPCACGSQITRVVVCLAGAPIGSQAGEQHRPRSRLLSAVAGIQHDGPLSTRCAQLCVVGVVEQGPGGHAGGAVFGAELRVAVNGAAA